MQALSSRSAFRGTAVVAAPKMQARSTTAFVTYAAQSLQGKVISTANDKTAVVAVSSLKIHPVYQKRINSIKKYIAHDEEEISKVGDIVELAPTRPLSKRKRFVVEKIVAAAAQ